MSSRTQKQHDLMKRVAQDEKLAEKVNIPQDVAREFIKEDSKLGLWEGGEKATTLPKEPGYLKDW